MIENNAYSTVFMLKRVFLKEWRLLTEYTNTKITSHCSPCYYDTVIYCAGYDVIAQAQSGTGKTATFAISILQQLDMNLEKTQALVLAPTRELAQQVQTSFWYKMIFSVCINVM